MTLHFSKKIIELLVKIEKDEEMPKNVRYKNNEWKFHKEFNDYVRVINGKNVTLFTYYILKSILSDYVEIIEDKPEKIEKISYILDTERYVPKMTDYNNSSDITQKICNRTMLLEQKLNEVIDKLNDLLEKSDSNE